MRGVRTAPEQMAATTLPSGIVRVLACYVDCPFCGEALASQRDGSLLLTQEDVTGPKGYTPGKQVTCFDCGRKFRFPMGANILRRAYR